MKNSFIFLFFLFSAFSVEAERVATFHFDEQTGVSNTSEAVSGTSFGISNNFNRPERIRGVSGNALRLDGWSTWASNDRFGLSGIRTKLSIEAWYATEAFTAERAAIVSQENANSGFSLQINGTGTVYFNFYVGTTAYSVYSLIPIQKYRWNHLVATVDVAKAEALIYLNGEEVARQKLSAATGQLSLANDAFYLGRSSARKDFQGFPLTVLNGALDEVSLYNQVLEQAEVTAAFEKYHAQPVDLTINPDVRFADDHLRPIYHAMPNAVWTNEPYGLIYHEDKYHLFFQKNPNGPYLYFMHWGHLSSPDLVKWTEEPIALAPGAGFDSFGIWSGTTIKDPSGKPAIIYTGVDGRKAGIGLARPTDSNLRNWSRSDRNPLVDAPPSAYQSMDFRDPYVFKVGDSYYMIVGSGLQNNGGGILFSYKSKDLESWQPIDPIYRQSDPNVAGYFWEMPSLVALNEKEFLLQVTPIPYNGVPARTLYWVGRFVNEKFVPYQSKPRPLELFPEKLLAPALGTDADGKPGYLGIIPEDRGVTDQVKAGWRQVFSLPRQIRLLQDSTLGQVPHPNLCRLRGREVTLGSRTITPGSSFNLREVTGARLEVEATVRADSGTTFSLQVFKHADSREFTSIVFDLARNEIRLDRRNSTFAEAAKTAESAPYVFDHREPIRLHVFLDGSTLEVFVDNVVALSCRVYPSRAESDNIDLMAENGRVVLQKLSAWRMEGMRQSTSLSVCPISSADLPNALRTAQIPNLILGTDELALPEIRLFPNPTTGTIYWSGAGASTWAYTLFNPAGAVLVKGQGENSLSLDQWPSGAYFLSLQQAGSSKVFRIIKN